MLPRQVLLYLHPQDKHFYSYQAGHLGDLKLVQVLADHATHHFLQIYLLERLHCSQKIEPCENLSFQALHKNK